MRPAAAARRRLGGSHSAVIAGGESHTLALKCPTERSRHARALDSSGQLGNGSTSRHDARERQRTDRGDVRSPPARTSLDGAALRRHRVGVGATTRTGQINGDGTKTNALTPKQVARPLRRHGDLGGRELMALAVGADGTVWAWGANGSGQLGTGNTTDQSRPVQAARPLGDRGGRGRRRSFGRASGTTAPCSPGARTPAGSSATGRRPARSRRPVQATISNATAIAAGFQHTLALTSDGGVSGVRARTTTASSATGRRATAHFHTVSSLQARPGRSRPARTAAACSGSDGTVRAWGLNAQGELLGDGSTTARLAPVSTFPASAASARSPPGGKRDSLAVLRRRRRPRAPRPQRPGAAFGDGSTKGVRSLPRPQEAYSPNERDACGIGFVVNIHGHKSRDISSPRAFGS